MGAGVNGELGYIVGDIMGVVVEQERKLVYRQTPGHHPRDRARNRTHVIWLTEWSRLN